MKREPLVCLVMKDHREREDLLARWAQLDLWAPLAPLVRLDYLDSLDLLEMLVL